MSAEEQKRQLLAEAQEAEARRAEARAEFEEEMAGATVKVKKKQQAEAAALASTAAQLNEGKQILAENAQKLSEMSVRRPTPLVLSLSLSCSLDVTPVLDSAYCAFLIRV